MSRINKTALAVVALITLSLAANPALAQNFDTPPFFAGFTVQPPGCGVIIDGAGLVGLAPTSFPNFALLSNAGIRQCTMFQGDALTDGVLIPANAPPDLVLRMDLAFITTEIGSGPNFNDTAEVFLEVLPTTTGPQLPIGSSQIRKIVEFSRNMIQPGGAGPLAPGAFAGIGSPVIVGGAGFPFLRPYSIPVGEFKGQRVFLTFTVRNALDTAAPSYLAVDTVGFGVYNSDGEFEKYAYAEPPLPAREH